MIELPLEVCWTCYAWHDTGEESLQDLLSHTLGEKISWTSSPQSWGELSRTLFLSHGPVEAFWEAGFAYAYWRAKGWSALLHYGDSEHIELEQVPSPLLWWQVGGGSPEYVLDIAVPEDCLEVVVNEDRIQYSQRWSNTVFPSGRAGCVGIVRTAAARLLSNYGYYPYRVPLCLELRPPFCSAGSILPSAFQIERALDGTLRNLGVPRELWPEVAEIPTIIHTRPAID